MQRVEKILERVTELPFSPLAAKILQLSHDDRAGAREIANVIARDQAFTARLLKIANSPYYGQTRPVTTAAQAVPVLGINTISSLALAFMSFGSFADDGGALLTLGDLWEHSIGCASWGRQIAARIGHPQSEETFTAGLLHDMGKALFYRFFKQPFLDAVTRSLETGIALHQAEQAVLESDHAAAGAAVARKWNLPPLLVAAIEAHHAPLALPADSDGALKKTVAIIHVADVLAEAFEMGCGVEGAPEAIAPEVWELLEIDLDGCKQLHDGVLEEVNTFRRIFGIADKSKRSAARTRANACAANGAAETAPPVATDAPPPDSMMLQYARLMEAGKQLALLAGLDDLLPNIAVQAKGLLGADAAHVLVPQGDALAVAGAAGCPYLAGKQLPLEGSLAGWVLKLGEKSVVSDIEKAQVCWEKKFFTAAGFRAHLIVPVDWAGKRLAVLAVHQREPRAWEAQELSLFDMFVGLAAVALENARLYQETEDKADALARINQQLTEALRVKARFLTTMSHELRTPLTVITGYANLMAEEIYGPLPPKMSEPVEKIVGQGNRLMSLINSILEMSELDGGKLTVERECFELRGLLDEASRTMPILLGDKPVVFETDCEPDASALVSDRKRLRKILDHLLDNAAKFTRHGKIVLRAGIAAGGIEIVVEDTGIGIAAEQQEIIFEGFRQVEQGDDRRYEGMGMGLYLSRRLAELLGGSLTVESRLGDGARFRLWLPAAEGSSAESYAL